MVRNLAYLEPPQPELLELSDDQLTEVQLILSEHKDEMGAVVPILQDINAKYNWLPPGALRMVAQNLKIPLTRVLRIATFYNMFSLEPRGEFIIKVCLGTACHVKGGGRLLERLERSLDVLEGGTTPDMRFTLEAVRCLGCCSLAPVVVINDETYGRLTSAKITKVLGEYTLEQSEA
ncbi:NADH-quinone oxidoreductase subunit NuoE [Planctomycetota bacterium]